MFNVWPQQRNQPENIPHLLGIGALMNQVAQIITDARVLPTGMAF